MEISLDGWDIKRFDQEEWVPWGGESGDAYCLAWGADRELLVPDSGRRRALWTPRVWPGAVLVAGELAGTWRRAGAVVTIQAWHRLSRAAREAAELEAQSFPIPGVGGPIRVRWEA